MPDSKGPSVDGECDEGELVFFDPEPRSAYPTEVIEMARKRMRYDRFGVFPCRVVLDVEGDLSDEIQPQTCGEPSSFYATDERARYGHVCRACWERLDVDERAYYRERLLTGEALEAHLLDKKLMLNRGYGKAGG